MSVRKATLAAVLIAAGGTARAADYTPPPAAAAGTVTGVHADAAGCATCAAGDPHAGRGILGKLKRPPAVVNLAPGACFGYFPTQWRKWEEVCPYPYSSTPGASPERRPAVPFPGYSDRPETKGPNGTLPAPRPADPKSDTPVPPNPNGARVPAPFPAPAKSPLVPVNTFATPPIPSNLQTVPPVLVNPRPLPAIPPIPFPADKVSSR